MTQDPISKKTTRSERLRVASQQRRNQEKQDVRQAILTESGILFLETGYEKFSLRQLAERIGYSHGTIYLYFQDKDELLFAIMTEGIGRFSQMLAEATQVSDTRNRLNQIGRAFINFGLQNPAHYQLMFMQRPDFLVGRRQSLPQPLLEIFALWQQIVEEAMKEGILRMGNPSSTGDTLWALLHGVVAIAILMPLFDEKRIHEMVENAIEMMTVGLHKA